MNPIISQTPSNIGEQQARFDRKKFDDFIFDKGYECLIERALACPCRVEAMGNALPDCQNCGGTGWFFVDTQKSVVACTSMSNKTKYEVWSEANMGTVNISSRPQDRLGYMDKITLTELESWYTQVLKLRDCPSTIDNQTYMFGFTIYSPLFISHIFLFTASNLPHKRLNEGDYSIRDNKILINRSVLDGNYMTPSITIKYTHNPTYLIVDNNRDMVKQKNGEAVDAPKTNLPVSSVGRRAHYVLNQPNYDTGLIDNTDYSKPTNYDR